MGTFRKVVFDRVDEARRSYQGSTIRRKSARIMYNTYLYCIMYCIMYYKIQTYCRNLKHTHIRIYHMHICICIYIRTELAFFLILFCSVLNLIFVILFLFVEVVFIIVRCTSFIYILYTIYNELIKNGLKYVQPLYLY